MSIILYEIPECIFCKKSKELFSDEIDQGTILVLPASEAPIGTNAFPYFVNKENNLTYIGYPSSKDNLYNKLNAALQPKENFTHSVSLAWMGIV